MQIGKRAINPNTPTYFIADVGSNHDGSLDRAIELIHLAAQAGADAVKFQHFRAEHIVSDEGFKRLGKPLSHQSQWKDSVFDTYKRYELPWAWTPTLANECKEAGVEFLSTPYDLEAVDHLDPFVSAFKVGSGDIDYFDLLGHIASKGKPVILATGASTLGEVNAAVNMFRGNDVALLQCNTNYTGDLKAFHYLNLRVLERFKAQFWGVHTFGLSDHTPRHVAVLGAVALGARIIEKHFTGHDRIDTPDHDFALSPRAWETMVEETRLLEAAMGDGVKRIEANEKETVIIQRRGWWGDKRLRPALYPSTHCD